jgi:ribosome maturation protein Sdo1
MDNQHKKIKGYRDLSQDEIDIMNSIKEKANEVSEMLKELRTIRAHDEMYIGVEKQLSSEQIAESHRSMNVAKENLQTGFMWLVRAVALPDSF